MTETWSSVEDGLHPALEILAGLEANGLAGRNLHGLFCLRIDAHAFLAMLGLEGAESLDLHLCVARQSFGDLPEYRFDGFMEEFSSILQRHARAKQGA